MINTQNSEIIEILKSSHLKVRPISWLSQLIDILSKPFLKILPNFIRDSLDFLIKCPREVDEDSELVTFNYGDLNGLTKLLCVKVYTIVLCIY